MADKSSNGWTVAALVVATIFFGVAFYAISAGPMYWLCTNSRGEVVGPQGSAFLVIYHPIIWLYQEGPPPARQVVRRYLELFEK